jgi:uncharacterized repeat protein (TIGR01451 family)
MILPLTQPIPIIRDTRRGPPKQRWRNPIVHRVINTLMPLIFITLPATSVLAEDFAYKLKATGTHSPDMTFSVKLTATGKETVKKPMELRDNFPLFSVEAGWSDECDEKTQEVCLPDNCEVDKSRGNSGYKSFTQSEVGLEYDKSEIFQNSDKKWCLASHVKICSEGRGTATVGGAATGAATGAASGSIFAGIGAVIGTAVGAVSGAVVGAIAGGTDANYNGYHVIYGKCPHTGQTWTQTQEEIKGLSINEKEGWVKIAEYGGSIGSSAGVPGSAEIDSYIATVISKTPANAPLQVGMYKGDPRINDGKNAKNGKELWVKTTPLTWEKSKTGIATIPTHDNGVVLIDSVSDVAPNKDTTYSLSIIKSGDTYSQNETGMVYADSFKGWLSAEQNFFVANENLKMPVAIIDEITPNPARPKKDVSISFKGHGEYDNVPNSPILTDATWRTNRSGGKILRTCVSTSECNFVKNALDLEAGQHSIGFSVNTMEGLESPEATKVLKINVPPLASIVSIDRSKGDYSTPVNTTVCELTSTTVKFPTVITVATDSKAEKLERICHPKVVEPEKNCEDGNPPKKVIPKPDLTKLISSEKLEEKIKKKETILICGNQPKIPLIIAVKWDDSGHDPIHFVGQAIDLDGMITKYKWELVTTKKMKKDGCNDNDTENNVISNKPTFFHNNLALGKHEIRFCAKDDNNEWSNTVQTQVMVMKPPTLLVHGLCSSENTWKWKKDEKVGNGYLIHRMNIWPNNERLSYGAQKVSEEVKRLTNKHGIPKVNIVAHSMGGLNSRWYIQNHGYRNDVNKLVMLGTPNHGATLAAVMKPFSSGNHATILFDPLVTTISVIGNLVNLVNLADLCATHDLIPQSSALLALNRNKKDEGYEGHEPDDNISTIYGSKVPYFNIYSDWFWFPIPTHYHVTESIVLPGWSFSTDFVVHEDSATLDNVKFHHVGNTYHNSLTKDDETLKKALDYLGTSNVRRKTRKAQRQTRKKVNKADALAGHVLYAPENGQLATISADESIEQPFEVDATINNLHVVLMGVATEDSSKPSLYLVSPSGEVIDENTSLSNVDYDNDNPNGVTYHITEVEPGTWTAVITSTHSEPMQYALLATGETNFWLGIAEGTQIEPGDPLTLSAYAQKDGSPMAGLDVNAVLVKTLDEGERIGKYGSELRDAEPVTVALTDIGNGHYELVYDDTTAPGAYRVFMTATDPETEASRVAFTTFFVEYDYELAIQSDDIQFSNEHPEHNETITISATIHNDSGLEANGIEVWFADGHLNEGGTVFAKETLATIAAGSRATITAPWLATAGPHDIVVIVSPMNTFIETNLDNNTASKTIMVADNPPVAEAGLDQKARFDTDTQANVHIFLDGSGSTDERPIERYEWDIDTRVDSNNDGITDNDVDLTGIRPFIPAGTYISLDTYEIKLTVFDALNQSHSDTLTVQLTEEYDFEPPVAEAGPNQSVAPGIPIYFDGSGSRDNYGMATYIWDIDTAVDSNGDGLPDNDVDFIGKRPVLTWGYPEAGIYTVKLTIADVAGNDPGIDTLSVDTTGQQVVAPTGPYRVFGTLEDQLGNSIAGATIQVADQTTITDATGAWEIKGLHEADYTLNASKAGYLFAEKHFILSDNIHKRKVDIEANSILQIEMMPFTRGGGNNGPSYLKALYAEQALPQGENLIYLITVTNEGHDIAKEIMLTNTLPENGELVSIEALTGGSCDASTMTCTLPDLANGAFANVQVEISNTQTEPLVNTASVMMNALTSDVQVITTEIKPYLSVTISDTPDPIEMLSPLNYTVDIELNQYAPSLASGIDLAMTLPLGVGLKSVMSNDASCNTNQFPEITCTLSDLNVNSQTTIGIDVLLEDAGLLALTHQAEVKANEYPTHTVIERTEIMIPDDIEVDIALVIDVTGSMREEINGIIDALKQFIAENDPNAAPLSALITFRDNVHVKAFTRDLNVLLSAVSELQVWGGGICQEAAVEALNIAIPHVKNGGKILFATDASPYHDADIDGVTEQLLSKGIRFNALLTGDCSDKSSWNELP